MPNVSKKIDIEEGLNDYLLSKDEESSAVLEASKQDLMRDIQEMIDKQNTKKLQKQSKKRVQTLVKHIKKRLWGASKKDTRIRISRERAHFRAYPRRRKETSQEVGSS